MFNNLTEVAKAVTASGSNWFKPDAMRFFQTRFESELLGGKYFVTSEVSPDRQKAFSIREVVEKGNYTNIATVGEFFSYGSVEEAVAEVEKLIARKGAKK